MSVPSPQAIREFLELQISSWNAGDKERMLSAYRSVAGNGLKVEYVGGPVLDGWPALDEMWTQYNSVIKIEIVEILVNGHEGACYLRNHATTPEGSVISPSLEIYNFGDGTLHARYFHNAH
ncbi:MAG: hypothetical protein JWM78_3130 [Verrucomicrobiaceae bacterium]|nr:hypothetical protein [Verrucomicrobiaceae bacterium]